MPDISYYKTEINDPTITRILVLSDIHADIHSFIIALRDCGEVIKKKPGYLRNFNQLRLDSDIEIMLKKNLNLDNEALTYKEDLNYEWIAENTYLVIAGDMIDGYRQIENSNNWHENYRQLEIKLILFINKLNEMAMKKNSRIIKILGNHELMNMTLIEGSRINRAKYIFPRTLTTQDYYKGKKRLDIFVPGNEGFDLLMKDGAGVLIKINNNIFVHGSLEKDQTFSYYDDINQILNNPSDPLLVRTINQYIGYDDIGINSMVWERKYGSIENVDVRIELDKKPVSNLFQDDYDKLAFCFHVENDLKKLTGLRDVSHLRVIVGHCIQSESSIYNSRNTTFTNIITDNEKPFMEIIEPPSLTGDANPDKNFIFGITMECDKSNQMLDHYLYRVDVGSSRAFDNDDVIFSTNSKEQEKLNLLSRTPQLLEIKSTLNEDGIYKDNLRIIRSTIKNTRIHLSRPIYEMHTQTNGFGLSTYNKYLKYKNKYLKLKNKLK